MIYWLVSVWYISIQYSFWNSVSESLFMFRTIHAYHCDVRIYLAYRSNIYFMMPYPNKMIFVYWRQIGDTLCSKTYTSSLIDSYILWQILIALLMSKETESGSSISTACLYKRINNTFSIYIILIRYMPSIFHWKTSIAIILESYSVDWTQTSQANPDSNFFLPDIVNFHTTSFIEMEKSFKCILWIYVEVVNLAYLVRFAAVGKNPIGANCRWLYYY